MLVGLALLTGIYGLMNLVEKQDQLKELKRQQEILEALYK